MLSLFELPGGPPPCIGVHTRSGADNVRPNIRVEAENSPSWPKELTFSLVGRIARIEEYRAPEPYGCCVTMPRDVIKHENMAEVFC